MLKRNGAILSTVLLAAATARAQPAPDPRPAGNQIGSDTVSPPTPPPTDATAVDPPLTGGELGPEDGVIVPPDPYQQASELPERKQVPRPAINMPEVLTTQTGWLLPAAVIYSRTSIDTGGGVTSDNRVGLGDVAEFGIATIDGVRERADATDKTIERIQPYVLASFRLGVAEERLFRGQPGITLGFRKSFERNHDDFRTRIAELTLAASKHLGNNVAIHVGGAFWDASVYGQLGATDDNGLAVKSEYALHDGNVKDQLRLFGGLEVTPLPHSQILVDLGWSPEFCYHCADADKIKLRPTLSWGVRYHVAEFMNLEAGVKVPDIQAANLLDAQIFGQVTFTSWALRRAVDALK